MLRRVFVGFGSIFSFAAMIAAAEPKPTAPAAPPRHLVDAIELVDRLSLKDTTYRHGEPSVTFTGTYASHADCSGFVLALVEHSYGLDADAVRRWLGTSRPTAARFYDAVVAEQGFLPIKAVADIRPGDVLAI